MMDANMSEYDTAFVNSLHEALKNDNEHLPNEMLLLSPTAASHLREVLIPLSFNVMYHGMSVEQAVQAGLIILDELQISVPNQYNFVKRIIKFTLAAERKQNELESAIEEARTRIRN